MDVSKSFVAGDKSIQLPVYSIINYPVIKDYPVTSRAYISFVLPIEILPPALILILSVSFVLNNIGKFS